MRKIIAFILCAALCLTLCAYDIQGGNVVSAASDGDFPAFPGAEGGGMYTTGARAAAKPEIYHVKNLDDSGDGSLRDAVSKSNRVIVFDMAGEIKLENPIYLKKGNLTILGQTAPGDGICISGAPTYVQASNIIVRYLRFRMGVHDYGAKEYDEDTFTDGKNQDHVIVDHCSMSWSNDECCSLYAIKDSTVQWCLLTEPLNSSIHYEDGVLQEHGYGGLWGGVNMSYHHNFISNAKSRFPRVATSATTSSYKDQADSSSLLDVRNNVFYNWRDNTSYGGENMVRVNLVNNYYREGPASKNINRFYQITSGTGKKSTSIKGWGTDLAIGGNFYDSKGASSSDRKTVDEINSDNTKGVDTSDKLLDKYEITAYSDDDASHGEYIKRYPIYTQSAEEAYGSVLDKAGASLRRDYVDELAVSDARGRTASRGKNGLVDYDDWINFEPIKYNGDKEPDTDYDGMPDTYEVEAGLDKNDASDALGKDAEGKYLNIEAYANWLVKDNAAPLPDPDPNVTASPKPAETPAPSPSNTPSSTEAPAHNITIDEDIQNGSIEINGASSRTVTWDAAERESEIGGAKTLNINGTDSSDGTLTIYDEATAVEEYDGVKVARADQGSNPSMDSKPFKDGKEPSGSVFMASPGADGVMKIEFFVYGSSSARTVHIYDNAANKDLYSKGIAARGVYSFEFECKAGNKYYAWIDGSKLGLKSVTVKGGGTAAKTGETVNVRTVPDEGYRAESVYVIPDVKVTKISENNYNFIMPDSDAAVGAKFVSADTPMPTETPAVTGTPVPTAAQTATAEPAETPAVTGTSTAAPEYLYEVNGYSFDSSGKINIDLKYNGGGADKAKLIIANYSESGILTSVEMFDITGADLSAVDYKKPESGNIKIFVWDPNTMEPLAT